MRRSKIVVEEEELLKPCYQLMSSIFFLVQIIFFLHFFPVSFLFLLSTEYEINDELLELKFGANYF